MFTGYNPPCQPPLLTIAVLMAKKRYDPVSVMETAKKRRKLALKLRKSGKTTQEIADIFGVSKQRASVILASAERDS